jgi:hypothetical protein
MQVRAGRNTKYQSDEIHRARKNASFVTSFCTQVERHGMSDEESGRSGLQIVCFSR